MGYTCRAKLAAAFHEAGHACMSLVLGRPIESVTVMFHSQRVFLNTVSGCPPNALACRNEWRPTS